MVRSRRARRPRSSGWRRPAGLLGSLPVALMALLICAESIAAAACYPQGNPNANEGAWLRYNPTSTRGIKGETDLVSASPLNSSTAIIHPKHALMTDYVVWDDVVGWGTAKGVGTKNPNAISNCPDNFDSHFEVYVDGLKFGKYFCSQPYGIVENGAQDQFFRVEYTTCPGDGVKKWTFHWNSVWKTCVTVDGQHGRVYAGSESVGTNSAQNLAITYVAIRYKNDSGSWLVPSISGTCVSDDYGLTIYSASHFAVYVQP